LSRHTTHITITNATTSWHSLCAVSYILESKLLSVAWMTLRAQIKIGPTGNSRL